MTHTHDLVLVGCDEQGGEAVLELLEARRWKGALKLLDDAAGAGKRLAFAGRHLVVGDVDAFDFAEARVALFAGSPEMARRHAPRAAAAGAVAVDVTGAFSEDDAVPLRVAGVSAGPLPGAGELVAGPAGAAVPLALLLQPLHGAYGVRRVRATICVPVSEWGSAGVEELARQTAAMLSGQPAKSALFPAQVAFNVQRAASVAGVADPEGRLAASLGRLFGEGAPRIDVAMLQVPVFYGFTLQVTVETDPACDAAALRGLLAGTSGVELHEEDSPSVVGDAAGSDLVHVGAVRDTGVAGEISLWAVADNIRCSRAANGVGIASLLTADPL